MITRFASVTEGDISRQHPITVDPSTWAFAIWPLIYTLILTFVIYQALPDSMVPGRNNDLIFNKLGYLPSLNYLLNSSWLFVFAWNLFGRYVLSNFIIIAMLVTSVQVMNIASSSKLTGMNFWGLRVGFSVYSGWLTAATILNVCISLKYYGFNSTEANIDETMHGVAILIVAAVIYMLAAYSYRNPVMPCVYILALFAIRDNQSSIANIKTTSEVVLVVLSVYVIGLTVMLKLDKNEKAGFFY